MIRHWWRSLVTALDRRLYDAQEIWADDTVRLYLDGVRQWGRFVRHRNRLTGRVHYHGPLPLEHINCRCWTCWRAAP
jgi:hypothetical protein